MTLKEEFVQAIQNHSYVEQPSKHTVYLDGDVEILIEDMGASFEQKENQFIIARNGEQADFHIEIVDSRFWEKEVEILIHLT